MNTSKTFLQTRYKFMDKVANLSRYGYVIPKDNDMGVHRIPYLDPVQIIGRKDLDKCMGRHGIPDDLKVYMKSMSPFLLHISNPYTITQSRRGVFSLQELYHLCMLHIKAHREGKDISTFADVSRWAEIDFTVKTNAIRFMDKSSLLDKITAWEKSHSAKIYR
jgi:hypothetical protein